MSDNTPWHQIFGAVQQEHMAAANIQVELEVNITSQPPRGDLLILQPADSIGWTENQRAYLPDGLRTSLGQHNLLELKYTEAVNREVFEQVMGYHYFYRQARKLPRNEVCCFILSSYSTEQATRETFGYTRLSSPGVYHSDNPLLIDIPLILLNELSNEPHNVFFKLFGSQQRAKTTALEIIKAQWLKRISSRLFWLLHGLFKHWFKSEEILMEETITVESLIESGKSYYEKLIIPMLTEDVLMELLQDTPILQKIEATMMEKGMEQGLQQGLEQGIQKGLEQGIEKGIEQGLEKGLEQGIEKGRTTFLSTLRRVLVLQFNVSLNHFDNQLEGLDLATLEQISEAAFESKSLAEFEATLARLVPPQA